LEKQDLLIVGAGTAGATAAAMAAKSGLRVCLVDMKSKNLIGQKVCGDAIAKHHFDNLKIHYPSGEEFEKEMNGMRLFPPDQETCLTVRGEGMTGFVINRHRFGQRLLKEALDAGATLLDQTRAVAPLIRDGYVVGIEAEQTGSGGKVEIPASITVDASGYSGAIRSKLPPTFGIESGIDNEDMIVAYREIRSNVSWSSDLGEIYLTAVVAPGGYYWIFDKGDGKVNVGLGVQMTGKHLNPKEQLYRHVLSQARFKDSKLEEGGGGIVPTRRPIDSLVSDGLMMIGDAACLVNPIHGGGIGPSMLSGRLAAEKALEALKEGNVSKESLWQYNVRYMQRYGGKQAGLDILRLLLQNISDDDLNFGLKNRLVKEEDILRTSMLGDLHLSIKDKAERALKGMGRPGFLMRLEKTASQMRKIKALYREYPSPKELERWKRKVASVYES